jgi:hypothetical protein
MDVNERLDSFCSSMDFVYLHKLCTMFGVVSKDEESIVRTVNEELRSLQRICYNSIDPQPLGPNCVFMSKQSEESVPIVIDSGASRSLSPFQSDFKTFRSSNSTICGIGAQSRIEGEGIVEWKIINQSGKSQTVQTKAYFVPGARIRLYSPQSHFMEHQKGQMTRTHTSVNLRLPSEKDSLGSKLTFPFHPGSSLPLMIQAPSESCSNQALFTEDTMSNPTIPCYLFGNQNKVGPSPVPPDCSRSDINCAISDEQNINLSKAQLELLGWHYRLGHISMHSIQRFMHPTKALDNDATSEELKSPSIISTKHKGTHTCEVPKCASCILAKMERLPKSTTVSVGSNDKHSLKGDDLNPGDTVSLDQYVVSVKGRTITNSSKNHEKVNGGTIFVDHASGKIFNYHQISLRTGETLIGKRMVERDAATFGLSLKSFLADNGVFTSAEFRNDLERKGQSIRFSGVGAHHQNGVAERAIKTISYLARANLIHSAIRWPDMHDIELWLLAFDHAVWIYNHLPGRDGLAPEEKWTGIKFQNFDHVRRLHPWGCPAYVLDPKLQDGKKLPKWSPRSRQGKFVGLSPSHASNVALVLNPSTKRISPQFHLLFDDFFSTVRSVDDVQAPVLTSFDWDNFIGIQGTENYVQDATVDDRNQLEVPLEWLSDEEVAKRHARRSPNSHDQRESLSDKVRVIDLTNDDDDDTDHKVGSRRVIDLTSDDDNTQDDLKMEPKVETKAEKTDFELEKERSSQQRENPPSPPHQVTPSSPEPTLRSSRGRMRKLNRKYFNQDFVAIAGDEDPTLSLENLDLSKIPGFYSFSQAEGALSRKSNRYSAAQAFVQTFDWDSSFTALAESSTSYQAQQFFTAMEIMEDPINKTLDESHPLAFGAKVNDADTPNWFQATSGENSKGFWEAIWKEIMTLQQIGAWEQVPRTSETKVILSTWAFKVKRFPSGLVRKLKARFCVRGDMQREGVDVFETFAPVVAWTTIRLLLILSVILDLETTQVDYTSAFCQAPMDHDVFVALPKGWQQLNKMGLGDPFKEGHVLRLKRSL